jgi:hypothetical protein
MPQPLSMAQQIAQTAIAFEEQRLGRKTTSVTVMVVGDTLVITMHGVFRLLKRPSPQAQQVPLKCRNSTNSGSKSPPTR